MSFIDSGYIMDRFALQDDKLLTLTERVAMLEGHRDAFGLAYRDDPALGPLHADWTQLGEVCILGTQYTPPPRRRLYALFGSPTDVLSFVRDRKLTTEQWVHVHDICAGIGAPTRDFDIVLCGILDAAGERALSYWMHLRP